MTRILALIGLCGLIAAAGCSSDSSGGSGGTGGSGPDRDYSATIVRTTYGIPHVTADDFGSLGYGAGYAYAQDNFCVLMKEIVVSNGQTARYFGEEEGNLNEDYVYTFFNDDDFIRNEFIGALAEKFQEAMVGYAAGLNRYLEETGVDNLAEGAEGCRGADWARPITDLDLGKVYHKLLVRAGISAVNSLIMAADDVAPTQSMASMSPLIESSPFDLEALNLPDPSAFGSNAYGIGASGSQTEYGILLGNPHFPWQGPERWYVQHLTVPGEYDVMGAALQGIPLVLLGFNENLAWSHTVSTAQRFTFYELDLVDDNPYQYHYDDEVRDIEINPVTIEVMLEDGTIEERTQNIYMSHYGPIVDLGGLSDLAGGWPTIAESVFAVRDANVDNTRIFDQFLEMGQSNSIDELEDALRGVALPWINTIAADRAGTGYYADVSTVPNVSQEKLVACADTLLTGAITDQGVASLNGSRSECEWDTDADGPDGLLGFANLPKIRTGEGVPYVSNSNDSYWLSSPNMLLENFSPLMGRNGFEPAERIQQSLRTRQGFIQAEERIAGTDDLGDPGFTVDLMRELMFQSRNIAGEMTRDDVVAICNAVPDWTAIGCGGDPDMGMPPDMPYSANPTEAARSGVVAQRLVPDG
ncbi:MAG: penicillin acylase family protein [Deltaproteobacteria bacterium]|nr:penicillin acylase family protein [Deltaproteobacteria bacterium]